MFALVVEDDAIVRSFLAQALERLGYLTDGAPTAAGAEALAARGREYEVALLDGLLPDGHGLELARRLLALPGMARTAICLLSGTVHRPAPVRAGISALAKPPRLGELLHHVGEMRRWRAEGSPTDERLAALAELEAGLLVG
jgi:DNA-binding response OmpR family regulator